MAPPPRPRRDIAAGALPQGQYISTVQRARVSSTALTGPTVRVGTAAPGTPREREILAAIVAYLQLRDVCYVRVQVQGVIQRTGANSAVQRGSTMVGWPDLLMCIRGRFVGIEVKRPGGRATALQVSRLEAIRRAGGVGEFVTSVADVERVLSVC